MGFEIGSRAAIRGSQCLAVLSLSAVVSTAAIAADLTVVDGLLQFPNVKVVNNPSATPPTALPGMRAYIDSETGKLRDASREELDAAGAEWSAASAPSARRSTIAAAAPQPYALRQGGIGITPDASTLQYSVMVRQPDGSLAEVCVMGQEAAEAVVRNSPVLRAGAKESINDR